MRGRFGPTATARNGVAFGLGRDLQGAIQPAIVRRFHARRAGLHVILRVKVRAGGIGRAGRVNDGQLAVVKQRRQRRERRVQAEEAIEVHGGQVAAIARSRNRNRRAHAIIVRLAERHHDVQAVRGAALKQHDEFLLAGTCSRRSNRALQKCRERAHSQHRDSAALDENPP